MDTNVRLNVEKVNSLVSTLEGFLKGSVCTGYTEEVAYKKKLDYFVADNIAYVNA